MSGWVGEWAGEWSFPPNLQKQTPMRRAKIEVRNKKKRKRKKKIQEIGEQNSIFAENSPREVSSCGGNEQDTGHRGV